MEEQVPGAARWVAMFAEQLAAQAEPLHRGLAAARDLDPAHWAGAASEVYALARPELPTAMGAVVDLHAGVRARVEGHNTFVHTLPHLLRDADPDERARLRALYLGTAQDVAAFLRARADALDLVLPDPLSESVPEQRLPEQVPEQRAPQRALSREDRYAALVRDEVIAGTRTERLRWAV
ncbi:hypothetical protein ACFPM7_00300 [Actinokineospora guangxiensis]|uniref:Hemerythrin HHE cation binding domain-containing protein n=1 Tax=Actinokineospora guangxiensis TaxID=1490288 RepID=A0ABW0EGX2_9PSEU